jgi:glutathione S-transferase
MLRIFHTPHSRSVRVVWLAEELGVPYEPVIVPYAGPKPAGFEAASPLGQLPAIEDGDARMIESVAIMQYLLGKHGPSPLEVKPSEKDFAPYLQFLHFGEANMLAVGSPLVNTLYKAPEDQRENWTINSIRTALLARLPVVSARLKDRDYIAGDRFTAADISVGFALNSFHYYGFPDPLEPRLQGYVERVSSRPGYKKATQAIDAPA